MGGTFPIYVIDSGGLFSYWDVGEGILHYE